MKLLLILLSTAALSHWTIASCHVDAFVIPLVQRRPMASATTRLQSQDEPTSSSSSLSSSSPPQQEQQQQQQQPAQRISNNVLQRPEIEPGSHEELMYTLGVNLARQLGDIRPLVEDGDELALVAKGLLDTVVGRLTEDGQKSLLASRGRDLNNLISDRA